MKAAERRQKIIDILSQTQVPISASVLAGQLGVSRQIIVGDVALLRAANHDVISTPRGYVLSQALYSHQFIGKIACQHGPDILKRNWRVSSQKVALWLMWKLNILFTGC
jgi:transcriptional regulator of NAD metabolism